MSKFGTKYASFGYFWASIFKSLLSYLKSAPSNWQFCPKRCVGVEVVKFANLEDFSKKTIMSKFRTKNVLFGHVWAAILKK